jgi:predicted esterase
VVDVLLVETTTHGRVLVERSTTAHAAGWLLTFHGYGESADDALAAVSRIPGVRDWHLASVQALNRFYTRNDEKVVASWMTRQDREQAIADNIAYVDRVVAQLVAGERASPRVVFSGFSQGVAMAYRAAVLGAHAAAGIIALGGDVPPELKSVPPAQPWPPVLIGAGDAEIWYTEKKVQADVAILQSLGVTPKILRYRGGHEWTDEFRSAAGAWLREITSQT